jgi:hypothetical protein
MLVKLILGKVLLSILTKEKCPDIEHENTWQNGIQLGNSQQKDAEKNEYQHII